MNEINQNKANASEESQEYLQALVKTIENLKNIISVLNDKLNNAEKETESLKEENRDLKSKALNVSELTKANEMYKMKIAELEREIKDYKKNQEIYEAEKANLKTDKGSVYVIDKDFNESEVHSINHSDKSVETTGASTMKSTKKPLREINNQEVPILESTAEKRRKCPNCGNPNPSSIRELVDKTRLIMDYPRMYGKKYICGECGMEWK